MAGGRCQGPRVREAGGQKGEKGRRERRRERDCMRVYVTYVRRERTLSRPGIEFAEDLHFIPCNSCGHVVHRLQRHAPRERDREGERTGKGERGR